MAFWSTPELAIKVGLGLASDSTEYRRLLLSNGASTSFAELHHLLQQRFDRALELKLTYTDKDGDIITANSDQELREALQSGADRFWASPLKESSDDTWDLLEDHSNVVDWDSQLTFWVNGELVSLTNPDPGVTLLDWLREEHGTLGSHLGCGEGGCGICTVALVLPSGETVPINSCLRKLAAVDGCHVINSQGLGNVQEGMHPVQQAIADGNGSQCGFCTPGWVMNMYALLQKQPKPSPEQVEQNFDGNLCRCTGYRPILSAYGAFAQGGQKCGGHGGSVTTPAGMREHNTVTRALHFQNPATGQEYFRPVSMNQLEAAVTAAGTKTVKFICASTGDGVRKYLVTNSETEFQTVFVDISAVPEMTAVGASSSGVVVGAGVSIETLIDTLEANTTTDPNFKAYAEHMKRIASVQIRAVGSWAGNLMLCRASHLVDDYSYFTSDMVVVLMTANAALTVSAGGKTQTVDMSTLMEMKGDVLLLSMHLPAQAGAMAQTFKAMQRHVFSHGNHT